MRKPSRKTEKMKIFLKFGNIGLKIWWCFFAPEIQRKSPKSKEGECFGLTAFKTRCCYSFGEIFPQIPSLKESFETDDKYIPVCSLIYLFSRTSVECLTEFVIVSVWLFFKKQRFWQIDAQLITFWRLIDARLGPVDSQLTHKVDTGARSERPLLSWRWWWWWMMVAKLVVGSWDLSTVVHQVVN